MALRWGGFDPQTPLQPPLLKIQTLALALHDESCVVVAVMWTDRGSTVIEKVVHWHSEGGGFKPLPDLLFPPQTIQILV